ncbi:hypothetical protein [Haladaptatus sp. DFWS20]|uniref:hypothetical protein n=1 Tax=Haladaptatus sp. DFWS20 TaxID=3403467 RepID=UPI003EC131BF
MSRFAPPAVGLLAILLVATILPAQVVALSSADEQPSLSSRTHDVQTTPFARNNSTIHHENPDSVESEGDLSGLERWLAGRLSSRLGGSMVQLEQGEYQKARSMLGDDYNDLLSKYVEVSGETAGTQDDRTAKTLQNAQRNQETFVSRVQRYRDLHDRYQRAKRNGNDKKARRLARRLERLENEINRTSGNLTSNYEQLSENTNVSTDNEIETVRNVTRNVSEQQATIRDAEFVATNLTATIQSTNVSFRDPVRVTGRLTVENGTGVANRSVHLVLGGNRSKRVRTSENGTFSLVGRPAVAALGNQSFRVEYRSVNESVFLGSNTTVYANVSQVSSAVTISNHSGNTRYNDTVSVSGAVRAGNVTAADVPVAIFVGQTRVGTTRTATNGTFSFNTSLPAGVPAGGRVVRVAFPFENRALTAVNASAPITVSSSATTLTLSGSSDGPRSVDLSGQLRTVDGTPIPNQRVVIRANGSQIASTTTDANGTYRVSLVLPATLSDNGNTTFVAAFDGTGKNVDSARDSTALALSVGDDGPLDKTTLGWLASFGLAGLITLGGFFLWRSGFLANLRVGDDGVTETNDAVTETTRSEPVSSSSATRTLLETSRSALEAGEFETAVEMAYAATRDRFDANIATPTATHWEFYNACRDANLSDDALAAIRNVTERYEETAFAANRATRETATTVIEAVSSLVGDEQATE